jgi:hypothetical protein
MEEDVNALSNFSFPLTGLLQVPNELKLKL